MTAADTYIFFELAGSTYGVRSKEVLHIDLLEHITPVPNTAPAVDGVVFSRGQVIPALNLRARFGFPRVAHTSRTRLIFLRNEQRTVAMFVDSALEFRRIRTCWIRPIEETLTGVEGNYIRAVSILGDRLVLLLDVGVVLTIDAEATPAGILVTDLQPSA